MSTATAVKVGTACLDGALESPEILIANAEQALAGTGFDTMVGSGFSGALVVPVLARAMGKNFMITRKPGDRHHHGNAIAEGSLGRDWLFVDDGVATGETFWRVHRTVTELGYQHGIRPEFRGAYLYGHGMWSPAEFLSPASLKAILAVAA